VPLELLYTRASATPPSAELMHYVVGHSDYGKYLRSGAEVYTVFDLACQRYANKRMDEFERTLDFGCGIGRILQFLGDKRGLSACDVYVPAVDYVQSSFSEVEAYTNPLMPPIKYEDDRFDLIYSFSVFSHLERDVEEAWLAELGRVTKPGGLLLLTVHGDWWIKTSFGDRADEMSKQGFFVEKAYDRSKGDIEFPEYYEASYHTRAYIDQEWSKHFDILDVISGETSHEHLVPGMLFEPRGEVPMFSPLGQDLVIARAR